MAEPPRKPVGLEIWPAELKLIESPVVRSSFFQRFYIVICGVLNLQK